MPGLLVAGAAALSLLQLTADHSRHRIKFPLRTFTNL
jgi:hypothetical protein